MSAKANQSKPKAAKQAFNSVKATSGKSPAKGEKRPAGKAKEVFYFVAGDYEPRITDKKPKPASGVLEYATFEEAKDQAVEQLIDLIDRCERRLWEIKRAENFQQYQQLSKSES